MAIAYSHLLKDVDYLKFIFQKDFSILTTMGTRGYKNHQELANELHMSPTSQK